MLGATRASRCWRSSTGRAALRPLRRPTKVLMLQRWSTSRFIDGVRQNWQTRKTVAGRRDVVAHPPRAVSHRFLGAPVAPGRVHCSRLPNRPLKEPFGRARDAPIHGDSLDQAFSLRAHRALHTAAWRYQVSTQFEFSKFADHLGDRMASEYLPLTTSVFFDVILKF